MAIATDINPVEQQKALDLHERLGQIDHRDQRQNLTLERSAPRKVFAAAVRKLFRDLGLKGISVTAPNYSMAQAIDIALPRRRDVELDAHGVAIHTCEASVANQQATKAIEAILNRVFPEHGDRSELHTDYFDYRWSIS